MIDKIIITILSHDAESGSEIMTCFKINKLLVVYRFSGNVASMK